MKTEAGQCADTEVHNSHTWTKTWGTWTSMKCAGRTERGRAWEKRRTVSAVERAFGADYSRARWT